MSKLILIDAMAMLHRAYHAIPYLTTIDGEPINAVYGFISILLRINEELKPTHIAVCYDRPEPTFRKKMAETYQAHRPEIDDGLVSQFEKSRDVLKAMNIAAYDKAGYEADDVIGTIAINAVKDGKNKMDEVIIVTGDRDILQMVDDIKGIKVYMPQGGISKAKLYGNTGVLEKMGVNPPQIVDYKALVGDASDNYSGVPGIGPKTAITLIKEYGGYPGIYKNIDAVNPRIREKLTAGKESGDMSYKLAKIETNVPVDFDLQEMDKWDLGSPELLKLLDSYGSKTLLSRIKNLETGSRKTENGISVSEKDVRFRKKLTKGEVEEIAVELAEKLKGMEYAIRGTASMVLQGLDMGVDDIDIICDKNTALEANEIFKNNLVKKVEFSESDKFRSWFGQFSVDGILIEVMGEFQVRIAKGWSETQDASAGQVEELMVKGKKVKVTKLDLELKTSADMGRWNEFHKIKKQLAEKSQQSLF